ncbi:ArsR/SmtB family transcription factor [Demequina muriae]|uniref:Metalloregulator ArsR/SmtB family transcription factor n=1 Tax=Demequina muriae TaxID=3051664 RepID=A0ABT8GDB4_9MICO|nr:metalloregulator ArsR/SmtB family transcription factor [Demequina sp. EGI L300058]MDN4479423.1 metalloregulator ArsR/SmtB family transcription factor [Demequina sp. EGI L300058]
MNSWNREERVRAATADSLDAVARVGKCLAHGTRVTMLDRLAQADRSVGELADLAGVKLTTASAHLQILKDAGLVETRRDGTTVVYALAGDHVTALLLRLYDVVAPLTEPGAQSPAETGREVVLDVRPPQEFAHDHYDGAVNVPLDELETRVRELPEDVPYVVYCRGRFCSLSHDAVEILRAHGRTARVTDVGVLEWRALDRVSAS